MSPEQIEFLISVICPSAHRSGNRMAARIHFLRHHRSRSEPNDKTRRTARTEFDQVLFHRPSTTLMGNVKWSTVPPPAQSALERKERKTEEGR